jgi:hypothetical protein
MGWVLRLVETGVEGSSRSVAELWRKLGDDEVRKAAYRGRCLKPA